MRRASALPASMNAWVLEQYKTPLIKKEVALPQITQPDQILIKVKAASVNPIDTWLSKGYGNNILSTWRQLEKGSLQSVSRLPLILGHDCCGEVVDVGSNVKKFKISDEVIAVIPGTWQGTHAEYVLTKANAAAPKPIKANYVEATTMPFVACTAWAALVTAAQVNPNNASGLRALIHGGSGGIGSAAIQMLNAWGAEKVVGTCAANNMEYVRSMGGIPIDYKDHSAKDQLKSEGPFDVILDCVSSDLAQWSDNVMKSWKNSVHVSIVSPLFGETDKYGIPGGIAATALTFFQRACTFPLNGRWFTYAYFWPNEKCLNQISSFIDNGRIKIPNIDRVYKFDEVPTAYIHSSTQDVRGKIVIDVAGDDPLSAGKEIADDPFLHLRDLGKMYRICIFMVTVILVVL
jgi:NADPH:quinone reductase-like Zn-dependent oxidoreductase